MTYPDATVISYCYTNGIKYLLYHKEAIFPYTRMT